MKLCLQDDCGFSYDIITVDKGLTCEDKENIKYLISIVNKKIEESKLKCDSDMKGFIDKTNATNYFYDEDTL